MAENFVFQKLFSFLNNFCFQGPDGRPALLSMFREKFGQNWVGFRLKKQSESEKFSSFPIFFARIFPSKGQKIDLKNFLRKFLGRFWPFPIFSRGTNVYRPKFSQGENFGRFSFSFGGYRSGVLGRENSPLHRF